MTDEAKWILENLTLPEKGFFIDVGSFDGVEGSNTLPFEERGWNGICIEADPLSAWKCAENRTCATVCAAIAEGVGLRIFHVDLEDRGLSGIDRAPAQSVPLIVPTITLKDVVSYALLVEPQLQIDLLSIDTEGTEINAWQSIGTIRPQIVIMEYYTIGRPRNDRSVLNEMISCGYNMVWENDVNMIFTYEK